YPRVKFWHDSLTELKQDLVSQDKTLVIRRGKPVRVLREIVEEVGADTVYYNRDYSPYARKRDKTIEKKVDVDFRTFKDLVLFEKREILTNSGGPYKVYTYYAKKWFDRQKPRTQETESYTVPGVHSRDIPTVGDLGFEKPEGMEVWDGGRKNGRRRLEDFKSLIGEYDESRDYPARDATSGISPHLRFGTVSVREAFWAAEEAKEDQSEGGVRAWQEQLAWRDFYFQVLWNWPETTHKPFLEQYRSIDWKTDKTSEEWDKLKRGKTGYPFVDAGMRELKHSGWMHNRLRMVVASFASKDLHIDWKLVHEYFKRSFVDAEVSAMVGGIQWAYSIGTDAQPYFRVFNP
ncbi:MAG: deoxyribodipyrimidine photo-lyase, partial [Halobacteria archaeon]|nr:deoxyribodipyrimidine photo-lyase [Halobacteria archaeon]